jgi:hypothetical protein
MFPKTSDSHYGLFVYDQVKALIENGHRVTVISPSPFAPFPLPYLSQKWKRYAQVPLLMKREEISFYNPKYVAYPKGFLLNRSGKSVFRSIKTQCRNLLRFPYDLIHAHVVLPDGSAAQLLSKMLGVPFVVTIHGADFSTTIYRNPKCMGVVRETLASAAQVIFVSSKLKNIGEKLFPDLSSRYCIIPNGVNGRFLVDQQEENNERPPECLDRFLLLSVSNLIAYKGIEYNLRAVAMVVKKIPTIHYLIIGDGPIKSELEKLSRELGIEEHVTFIGAVSNEEVKRYMKMCDLFTLPSWNEAFGIVYLEAMACGKSVIGCMGEGIEDIVSNGETGWLVPPRDSNALAERIMHLYRDEKTRVETGMKAKKTVCQHFTWENSVGKMCNLYSEIIARGRGGSSST